MLRIKVATFFSGIDAPIKALERLKIPFQLTNYCEVDPQAAKANSLIHNVLEELNLGDIKNVNINMLSDFDFCAWGFPCTDISAAGEQAGIVLKCTECNHIFDITQTEDYLCPYCNSENLDSITESGLYYYGWKILKVKQPKYSLIENVKNLTQKKFKNAYDKIKEDLDRLGYNVYDKVLNAKDYGIPQNRERVFIVCIRKDVDDGTFKFPETIPLKKQLKDIIEIDAELPILHNIYGGFKETKPRIFTEYSPTIRTSKGGGHIPSIYVKGCSLRTRNYRDQPQQLEFRKDDNTNTITTVFKDSMVAIVDDTYKNRAERVYEKYSPTIRSQRKGLKIINGKLTRYLTTLEALRLMDFDDEDYFKLKDNGFSDTAIYKMAGNSIVVSVLEEIYKKLFKLK